MTKIILILIGVTILLATLLIFLFKSTKSSNNSQTEQDKKRKWGVESQDCWAKKDNG